MPGEELKGQSSEKAESDEVSRAALTDFICKILDEAIENRNANIIAQESVRDLINDAHKK